VDHDGHGCQAPHASFAVMERLGLTHHGTTDRWYGVTLEWWSLVR
jgi:hypothetical protein